jgi:hypothetical protein
MTKRIAPNLTEIIDQDCDCGGVEGCQSCEARAELRALKRVASAAKRQADHGNHWPAVLRALSRLEHLGADGARRSAK